MTPDEIKKAIEISKELYEIRLKNCGNIPPYVLSEEAKALQILIDLAQSVLDAKMPKKKEFNGGMPFFSPLIIDGYNSAFHDFRLWQEKCLLKLEEDLAHVYCEEKHSKKVLDPELLQSIIQAIRKHLLGGEK